MNDFDEETTLKSHIASELIAKNGYFNEQEAEKIYNWINKRASYNEQKEDKRDFLTEGKDSLTGPYSKGPYYAS